MVFKNVQAIKWDSVPPDIDDTVVYELPIESSGKITAKVYDHGAMHSPVNLKIQERAKTYF